MSFLRRRRGALFLAGFILLALFVLRPGANGLRRRIVSSISLSLGRRVDVQWVKVRVLPQPGFDLVNFVVYDDPAYSAEPVLRAEEVTAVLRLRSLLRGRMEIGRLSLKEPSFNLVRGENGHWNIESLIERAAHTSAAPTRNTLPERRPVFPYIEAENGRINFKIGMEKKSYSLTDADFALWLESDSEWSMRLAAQPVRTDFNLTDTGTLRVTGSWQRSGSLSDTPLQFTLAWGGAQLGALTKLLYGRDLGWRGGLTLSADFSGSPADLKIAATTSIDDFRRYDIVTQKSLRLATTCQARYSSIARAISDLVCRAPIGQGLLSVKGRVLAPTGPRTYDLTFAAEDVPMQALVNLARRAKKDLPDDLSATGTVAGSLALRSLPAVNHGLEWTGSGRTERFALRSASGGTDLAFGSVPFNVQSPVAAIKRNSESHTPAISEVRLGIGPVTATLGKQSSVAIQGWASRTGYNFALQGEGSVQRLLQAAQVAGLQVPQLSADGIANFNFLVAGPWSGFTPPRPTGTVQLRSIRAQLPGISGGVDIRSATLLVDEDTVHVNSVLASAAGSNWEGWLSFPRPCHLFSACPIRFGLHGDRVASDRLHQWLSPPGRKRTWYGLVDRGPHNTSLVSALNATGTISANRVEIRGVAAGRVACSLHFHNGSVQLTALTADVLGGKYRGEWSGNLIVSPPEFAGSGKFEHVDLSQLATAMRDGWVTGSAKGTYQFSSSGKTVQDWLASAKGSLSFDMREGSLPHIALPADGIPLRVRHFTGRLLLSNSAFTLEQGKLESGNGNYEVTGTASSGQTLELKFARAAGGFVVDGPLSAPHVVPVNSSDTRASLKP